ncbi:MAG: hypothetical protein LBB23_00670 [Rickettsiales bacterium]|nr:hypothetical protein [Rickettsiales bacterium]
MKILVAIFFLLIFSPVFAACPDEYYESRGEYERTHDIVVGYKQGCKVIRTNRLDGCASRKSVQWMEFNNQEMVEYGYQNILYDGTDVQCDRVLKKQGFRGFYKVENHVRVSINGRTLCERHSEEGYNPRVEECEQMAERFMSDKCKDRF